jgi:hypothetical protein
MSNVHLFDPETELSIFASAPQGQEAAA